MSGVYYDPYNVEIEVDPYPVYKRLRDEAPLYYNEKFDFWALSRFEDVEEGLKDWRTFSSAKGTLLELIKADIELPPGTFIFEDPPAHDLHRGLLSRVFTPRRMLAVEDLVRGFCARALDPLMDRDGFDFVADLGAIMPMRTIGYLLGIPEEGQEQIRQRTDQNITVGDAAGDVSATVFAESLALFAEYIEWRASHPSDDLMTDLLNAQVEEPDGALRKLERTEVLAYTAMIAGAGGETTARLIGFMGELLGNHPDQRRELVADPSLIPSAVEETLRFEPPSPVQARYVARDVELYGQTVAEGSFMLLLNGSANRDDARYADPDRYDIHRKGGHLSFGQGLHFCLGSALARLEARVAFEEVFKRWSDWEVDYQTASRARTSSVRGWARMPVRTG